MKGFRKLVFMIVTLVAVLLFFSPGTAKADSEPSVKIDEKNIDVDINTPFTIKVKKKYLNENNWIYYDIKKLKSNGDYEYYFNYTCEEKKTGKYRFTIYDSGTFILNISAIENIDDWDRELYRGTYTVTVKNIGPEKRNMAILVGSSQKINIDRGVFVSAEYIAPEPEEDPLEYYYDEDDWFWDPWDWGWDWDTFTNNEDTYVSSLQGEVSVNGDKIKAVKEGRTTVKVTWKNEAGEEITENLTVDVIDPVYTPYDGYYLANFSSIHPSITHRSEFSEIKLSTDNEKVCKVDYGALIPLSFGTCTLSIIIDGKEFTDTINVYDPKLSDDMMLIKKKTTTALTLTGIPEGIPISYEIGNKKIVSVDENGNVKAKKLGNTYILVHCEGLCNLTCSVTVGDGKKGMKAALQAREYIGAAYSQENRMKDNFFDCSSLAWRSYKASGTAIGGSETYAPTAADLGKNLTENGKKIADGFLDPEELKPGDLIFYSTTKNGRYLNIDHVAVYYGANYCNAGGWYSTYFSGENNGAIIHARSEGVESSNYRSYVPGGIVLICRP